ncbi:MAG TPA: methylated-DNA--[protein]-cysteine S-methyltransferase [Alphaproteobacteria bacterium]|nr:methylated-DNA--[protein]-cysteine S-methyltransferase [Alphaproteobacteria bacterium]
MFDTGLGTVGVAWSERGLTRLQLPESTRVATERRLRGRSTDAGAGEPPLRIGQAMAAVERYLAGKRVDFSKVDLDLAGVGDFHRQIYEAARGVGWGETVTYGELARRVGSPGAARAVGQAMGRNPIPLIIPCHRVLASGRKIGGFSAFGGAVTKTRLLALEGVHLDDGTPLLPGLLPASR